MILWQPFPIHKYNCAIGEAVNSEGGFISSEIFRVRVYKQGSELIRFVKAFVTHPGLFVLFPRPSRIQPRVNPAIVSTGYSTM